MKKIIIVLLILLAFTIGYSSNRVEKIAGWETIDAPYTSGSRTVSVTKIVAFDRECILVHSSSGSGMYTPENPTVGISCNFNK